MVVGGRPMVDRVVWCHSDVADAAVEWRGRQQSAVGLDMIVALGFHWKEKDE